MRIHIHVQHTHPLISDSVVYPKVVPFRYFQVRHYLLDQLFRLGLPLRNMVGTAGCINSYVDKVASKTSCTFHRSLHEPYLNTAVEDLPVEQLHKANDFTLAALRPWSRSRRAV